MSEIYVSTDVETDGPIPGPHSMLSSLRRLTSPTRRCQHLEANLQTLPECQWSSRDDGLVADPARGVDGTHDETFETRRRL